MTTTTTPALSVRQPWAWLILHAGKDIENRTWRTRYRGPLLIHASKAIDTVAYLATYDAKVHHVTPPDALRTCVEALNRLTPWPRDPAPTGALVGVVDLVGVHNQLGCHGVHTINETPLCSPWAECHPDYGAWHWRLANPRTFAEPIPCRGYPGLFRPKVEVPA